MLGDWHKWTSFSWSMKLKGDDKFSPIAFDENEECTEGCLGVTQGKHS